MIRVVKGPEPAGLVATRTKRLADARVAIGKGEPIKYDGYGTVKNDLAEGQRHKCCYCEILEQGSDYRDVEHYRPKALYWWLTWTWENLYFVCFECNRQFKKAKFPLSTGSTALVAEQSPPGNENPLVLDPGDGAVDPVDEIRFCKEKVGGLERWVPRPRNGSALGRETIEVCGLDRPGLLTLYSDHVNSRVRPKVDRVTGALNREDAREIVQEWGSATRALVSNPSAPFRALSYDALHVLVPSPARAAYGLALVPPR